VRRDGRSHAHPLVVLAAWRRSPPALPPAGPGQPPELRSRLGVVAGRAVGKAVDRNRAKRLVREAFRKVRNRLMGVDVVVEVRRCPARETAAAAGAEIAKLLEELRARMGAS